MNERTRSRLGLVLAAAAALLLARSSAADAPEGHYTIEEEVVLDTATRLEWQRVAAETAYGLEAAERYCTQLALAGGGWRLPTIKELHTLVDESRTLPAIDTEAFEDTAPDYFWTGSRVATLPQYGWCVSFYEGIDGWFPAEMLRFVRCVRTHKESAP